MLSALLAHAAFAAPPLCGLPLLGPPPPLAVPHTAPPAAARGERDPYDLPEQMSTEHFTARWGSAGAVEPADVAALLDAFETAWSVEITELGHPAPEGTDAYTFNIYIGDTGDGAPDGYGTGGYYSADREGYPMVVVSRDTLDDPVFAEITAAHEFYHAIQHAMGTYPYAGLSAWYWEATAVWMSGEVFPDNADYAIFLFGFALLPYLPAGYFDYPDTGALGEFHQYGAFILPRFLSEQVADRDLIRDSWMLADDADPLVVLDGLLAEHGTDMATVFTAFAAHNTAWDYADQEVYEDNLRTYEGYYDDEDARVVATLPGSGNTDWTSPPESTLPQRYGYNVLRRVAPDAGTLTLDFAGDSAGSEGSEASFGVTAVVTRAGVPVYTEIPLDGTSGSLELELDGSEAALYLVVAAWSDELVDGETFGYRYRVESVAAEDTDSGEPSTGGTLPERETGCGCGAPGAPAGGLGALGALVLAARRRQRRTMTPTPVPSSKRRSA